MIPIVVLLLSFVIYSLAQNNADLGTLNLEMHSKATAEARTILSDSALITKAFLNQRFSQYFDDISGVEYFNSVTVAVVTMDQINDLAVTIDFRVTASFQRTPLPGKALLASLLHNAFTGDSISKFVNDLQRDNNAFIHGITYLIVSLNGTLVANLDVAATNASTSALNTSTGESQSNTSSVLPMVVIIVGACAALMAIVMIVMVILLMKKDSRKSSRSIEIPAKTKVRGRDLAVRTTSKETTVESSRSVSPLRSVLSQDSSVFTYNPGSTRARKMSQDVGFGSDDGNSVTEIDKKDLSLIQEGENEEETPVKPKSILRNKKPLEESPQQLKGILRGKNKPMSPQVVKSPIGIPYSKVPSSKTRRKKQFMNESWYSEDDAASQCSDDSDVIKDLNNLSRQVNRHRGHY